MQSIFCPECEHYLNLGSNPFKGQQVVCSNCHVHLIVAEINNFNVEIALDTTAKRKPKVIEVDCPQCETILRININAREGQPLSCPECQASLEVVSVDPIEVDFAIPINLNRNRQKKYGKQSDRIRRN